MCGCGVAFAVVSCSLLWTACQPQTAHSPEQQRFFGRCAAIEVDMTYKKVDSLFEEYESFTTSEQRDCTNYGNTLVGQSVRTKTFNNVKNPDEGDYYVNVYFDETGRVVGKQIGAYCN